MNYSIRTNDVFTANKALATRRTATVKQREVKKFAETHTVSVSYEKEKNQVIVDAKRQNA